MAGLRERKKQATRDAVVRAGLELFGELGYEATPVTRVAEAAMISPATFFSYFPTKEDVVFADQPARDAAVRDTLRSRAPDEPVAELLRRALDRAVRTGPLAGSEDDLLARRGAVVAASPALRAAVVRRLFDVQQAWVEVLGEVAPELTRRRASVLVGAVVGAAVAVAGDELAAGGSDVLGAVDEAIDLTLAALA